MKQKDSLLRDYLKNIKKTLAYQTFTDEEKARWETVITWTLLRARGTEAEQLRAISTTYFAFIQGLGGTTAIIKRQMKGK